VTGRPVACARQGTADLKDALISEVRRRTDGRNPPPIPRDVDLLTLSRARLDPLVRGLFPRTEQEQVLTVLAQSIVFLSANNIWSILRDAHWPHTAWDIANLYLASVGAHLLGPNAEHIVGLREETTCWVSLEYFARTERFADFVVHEAAHVFHNCKRRTRGCPRRATRSGCFRSSSASGKRFAYACEAYAVLDLGLGLLIAGPSPRAGPRPVAGGRARRRRRLPRHSPRGRRGTERLEAHPCPLRARATMMGGFRIPLHPGLESGSAIGVYPSAR
jgi:hypothetical protein